MTVSEGEIQKIQKNPETELQDTFNDLGIKESEPSPRGVLEIPIISDESSVSDSPKSSSSYSCSSMEKSSSPQKSQEGEGPTTFNPFSYGVQFKGFINVMKRKTGVRRFSTSTINLLSSYDLSAKSLRKKLGRIRSAEDSIDCGLLSAAKPSWRNFKYPELAAATDHFSPDCLVA